MWLKLNVCETDLRVGKVCLLLIQCNVMLLYDTFDNNKIVFIQQHLLTFEQNNTILLLEVNNNTHDKVFRRLAITFSPER